MKSFLKLFVIQAKLYLREPMGVFFTLLFGPVMVVLLGLVFGNDPDPLFGGLGHIDVHLPAYVAVIIGIVGLTTVPITTATRREKGVLRRFSATPLRPFTYFLTDILVSLIMSLIGILLLFVVGKILYDVNLEGNLFVIFAAICFGAFTFFALGYALASLVSSARTATVIGNVVLFPMMFLSGAFVPLEVMPEPVRNFCHWLPFTHLVTLIRGLCFGESWGNHLTETIVLSILLVIGVVIATRKFRWE
jgi:ABC-2 type transport system permease protein